MIISYNGLRWGVVFLKTPLKLSQREKHGILEIAINMLYEGTKETRIKEKHFEGRIYTEGKHALIGHYHGQVFRGELDTEKGSDRISLIISDQSGNGLERNLN